MKVIIAFVLLASVSAVLADSCLATLYASDPFASSMSFASGTSGTALQDGFEVNAGSDVDFGGYSPYQLSFGIQGAIFG